MNVLNMNFIVLLTILLTVLDIILAQARCPLPRRRPNVLIRIPRAQRGRRPLAEDTVLAFKCAPGFNYVRGDIAVICLNGRWESIADSSRSSVPIQCRSTGCPLPQRRPNVLIHIPRALRGHRTLAEDTLLALKCVQGFNYVRGDKSILCVNGRWESAAGPSRSSVPFQCKPGCPLPQRRPNVLFHIPRAQRGHRTLAEDTLLPFKCVQGFNYVRGDKLILCVNGRWESAADPSRSSVPFQCRPAEKQCHVQDIPNGKMKVGNNLDVTYSCNQGYELEGFPHAHCRKDEKGDYFLTSPLPSCNPLPKCTKPTVPNLQVRGSCCFAGDLVRFFCDDGYTLEGEKISVCQRTGNWCARAPHCERVKQCTHPGYPARSSRTGDCCEVGSVLTYECDDRYELMDKENGNSITCLHNEEWSGEIPQCKPIEIPACPNIPFKKNKLTTDSELPSDQDVFLAGSKVDLHCKTGYYTEDEEMFLLCLSDGTWDTNIPTCKPKAPCSRPLPPSHGRIAKLKENPNMTEFPMWYEIVMECDRGYVSMNGRYGSQCHGNDVWSNNLNCTRITCSNPGVPKYGHRDGDDFHFNSSVTFSCMDSYQLIGSTVRTCQQNGRWSGFTTVCDAGGSDCLDPGVPVNSKRVGDNFNIGDVVTYFCKNGTTLIGNRTRVCLEGEDGAYWSGAEIECRAQHEFTDEKVAELVIAEIVESLYRPALQCTGNACVARTVENANKIGSAGTDVFFAFDGSAGITAEEFERAKDFVLTLIRQIGTSQSDGGVRVAVTIFSKTAKEIVQLGMRTDVITRELQKMTGNRKRTNIRKGLEKLMEFSQRSIPNRKKIAFVITDGIWDQGGDPTRVANTLRDPQTYNVEIFAIGIGNPRHDDALVKIVGPDKNRVLLVPNYEELLKITAKAIKRNTGYSACGSERPIALNDGSISGNRQRSKFRNVERIVGGEDVKKPWPWMTVLAENGVAKCGGSLIHQQWILTAAHCFDTAQLVPSNWLVTIGATDLSKDSGWDIPVSSIIIHDKFNTESFDFDAALLKLKILVPYDLYIRPVCLPPAFIDMPKNTELYAKEKEVMIIGYGNTKENNLKEDGAKMIDKLQEDGAKMVDKLQEVELPLQPEEVCQKEVKHGNFTMQPTPQMICAGSGEGGKDACKGDSGGPLMQLISSTSSNNTQDRWFLVGIKSWRIGCGLKGYYGYYTYVSKLREWIENVTKIEFENVVPQSKPVV